MKTIFNVWVLLGICIPFAVSENNHDSDHLTQDAYHDTQEAEHYPNSREHLPVNSYEYVPHEDENSGDPGHYQSLEGRHHAPKAYSTQYFRQYHDTPHVESQTSARHPQYYGTPEHNQYNQPEDTSHHRPQEVVVYHQPSEHGDAPRHDESYHGSPHYPEPESKDDDLKYKAEEPKYTQGPRYAPSSHPGPVPTDPKLPLYFTMYEKRTVQDPLDKYGKGPWRYLTYGHGISYGTKGPGKVFEKGYGYIRALGRDHCKLPEHLCPPKDEKPFEYEGRKEPYFGYRPH